MAAAPDTQPEAMAPPPAALSSRGRRRRASLTSTPSSTGTAPLGRRRHSP